MFKKRRRHSSLKIIGLILALIGSIMFLYIIPLQVWYLIIAGVFVILGIFIFKIF